MDARLDPARLLGLEEGDAHVIRNAGGRASEDAIRSLVISLQLLGTNTVVVIDHTDCGMPTFSNTDLRTKLKQELGANANHIDFLPFGGPGTVRARRRGDTQELALDSGECLHQRFYL
jgi:carbonic anhydrase